MQYYCHNTERDVLAEHPTRGKEWPFVSPHWKDTEAAFELYELVWKFHFLVQIGPLDVLERIVAVPGHRLDAQLVDIQFAVDWQPPGDNAVYHKNFIDRIRETAYHITVSETKRESPWYANKPATYVEEMEATTNNNLFRYDEDREWFIHAKALWQGKLDNYLNHLAQIAERD